MDRKGENLSEGISPLNTLLKGTMLLNRELWHAAHFKPVIQHGKFHWKSYSFIHELQRVNNTKEKSVSFTSVLHVCKTLTIHFYGT